MTVTTLLSAVAHVAPIIFLLTMVITIGNSRIANYQLNGGPTLGFSIFLSLFCITGIFASVQTGAHPAYAIAYLLFAIGAVRIAIRIYYGISNPVEDNQPEADMHASAPLTLEKPFEALTVPAAKKEPVLETAEV